ncbi:hypothetical protein KFL_006070010 [Klebsormidium nitens]|uniref:Uncharacterized protein n=1 Tax=Klebsormidium nitens TaxID=105231 RepID=A0A1Y1IL45_KLENI|nr:hypothetical protein KFL_006070010 [Klebsormidium nitens]|eukprot:GAQ90159.1 hypothetical protein KFL_006070010 [Klebsormidium nitens]
MLLTARPIPTIPTRSPRYDEAKTLCTRPPFSPQCFGDAGTTFVCCDSQSCGLSNGAAATCASGKYPSGSPTPSNPPPATPAPTPQRNPNFDPVQSSVRIGPSLYRSFFGAKQFQTFDEGLQHV